MILNLAILNAGQTPSNTVALPGFLRRFEPIASEETN
jgi:hypothetical protein